VRKKSSISFKSDVLSHKEDKTLKKSTVPPPHGTGFRLDSSSSVGGRLVKEKKISMESLILAQDERWRYA